MEGPFYLDTTRYVRVVGHPELDVVLKIAKERKWTPGSICQTIWEGSNGHILLYPMNAPDGISLAVEDLRKRIGMGYLYNDGQCHLLPTGYHNRSEWKEAGEWLNSHCAAIVNEVMLIKYVSCSIVGEPARKMQTYESVPNSFPAVRIDPNKDSMMKFKESGLVKQDQQQLEYALGYALYEPKDWSTHPQDSSNRQVKGKDETPFLQRFLKSLLPHSA